MLEIDPKILNEIRVHGEKAYPEEGAGLLLGVDEGETRRIMRIFPISNAREDGARHNRYTIDPREYLQGEAEAERLGLTVVGVFHSHPDHPNRPSEFDKEWAQPFFSYIITSVEKGKAAASRSWRLEEDRSGFREEPIVIKKNPVTLDVMAEQNR